MFFSLKEVKFVFISKHSNRCPGGIIHPHFNKVVMLRTKSPNNVNQGNPMDFHLPVPVGGTSWVSVSFLLHPSKSSGHERQIQMCRPDPTEDNVKALEDQENSSSHTKLAAFYKTPKPSLLKGQELELTDCFCCNQSMFQGRLLTHEIQNMSLYLFFKTPTPITEDYQQLSEEQTLCFDNDTTVELLWCSSRSTNHSSWLQKAPARWPIWWTCCFPIWLRVSFLFFKGMKVQMYGYAS